MIDDATLLRRYAHEHAQDAFAELVRRHLDLVYAAALRRTGGDAHRAADVAQQVFATMAREAATLARHTVLAGWLYTATRNAALNTLRAEERRRVREEAAFRMQENLSSSEPEADWQQLRPVLDAAMDELDERDREAVVVRFFQGRAFAEVGAVLRVSEDAARKRVERALEKLRERLARRGITSTAAALGAALAAQPAVAAPAAVLTATVATGLTVVATGWSFPSFMRITKITAGITSAAVLGTAAYLGGRYHATAEAAVRESEFATLRAENQALAVTAQTAHAANADRPLPGSVKMEVDQRPRAASAEIAVARGGRGGSGGGGGGGGSQAKPADAGPLAPAPTGALAMLVGLQDRGLVWTNMTFVTPSGKLSPAFAELFALTSGEQATLQQSLDRATERLAELESTHAVVSRDANGSVVINVNPFAAEGGVIYDGLMKSFADTLGPERNGAYVALGATQVERALGQLGAGQRTVTFSLARSGSPDGPAGVGVKIEHRSLSAHSSSSSSFRSLGEAVDYAGTIGRLVPADFSR